MDNTIRAIIAFTLFAVVGQFANAATVNDAVNTTTLDNGLRIIVREDHSANLVAVDVWVGAGSVNETEETNGVSHFIEHLLFRATDKRGPGQADMEIESLGATLEARTSRDWAHFYTVVARGYLDKTLDVVGDVVTHPLFRQVDLDHEREIILDEIARKDSDPFMVLTDRLFKAAYTVHPYRLPVEGTRDSVNKITREAVVDYYNRLYVPENMCVVIVGDITPAEAVAAVKKSFADFRPALRLRSGWQPATTAPTEPVRTDGTRETIKKNTRLTYVGVAFPGPSVKDRPDVFATDVLLSHLGIGYQSWMSAELKDRQKLAVQVSSDYLTQKDPALVIFEAATEPSKAKDAEAAILAKVADIRNTLIGAADLDRAKAWLLGNYAFDVETFSGRATNIGFYNTIGAPDLAESYEKNIRDVTAQNVLDAAKKYLDPDKAVVVVIGP